MQHNLIPTSAFEISKFLIKKLDNPSIVSFSISATEINKRLFPAKHITAYIKDILTDFFEVDECNGSYLFTREDMLRISESLFSNSNQFKN